MKVKWHFIKNLRLDPAYGLLNARSTLLCWEIFTYLDWKQTSSLDDIQFSTFLTFVTDLKLVQAERVFDIFDLDRSGSVEFDEVFFLGLIVVLSVDLYSDCRSCIFYCY
jgi:hypothetical protein